MPKYLDVKDLVHSNLKTDSFEKLLKYCMENRILFSDKQFPNNNDSLFQNPPHKDYRNQWKGFTWTRAETLFGKGGYTLTGKNEPSPSDIRQGSLGDCYFLCSLASLAEEPSLIKRLFHAQETNEHGVMGVWLFINGHWTLIVLDEYFPVTKTGRGSDLAFSKTLEKELWVLALEKAYAKAYGSYFDITGGDPVHALRDLTGAPYDRIEDYSDLAVAWVKLKEADAHQYPLTCFTKSAEVVEQKSGNGLVSGHAYSILDVREVVDSRGKIRMIVQIRNPWGKFEWQGEFSDNSSLWTPKLRSELKVVTADDGIFWMPFESFVQFYEGIGIIKVQPGHVNNSIVIKRNNSTNKTLVRLTVNNPVVDITISIDQMDTRWIDKDDYSYSYFRVTIGRIDGKDKIEFIDTVLSPERNVFLEGNFKKGDYVVLVEAYWSSKHASEYAVGSYSDYHVDLELLGVGSSVYQASELLLWQNFAMKNKKRLKPLRSKTVQQGNLQAPLELFNFQDQNYGCNLYATFNNSDKYTVHDTYKIISIQGYDVVAGTATSGSAEMLIGPKDVDILLFKMNPTCQSFKLSHQVVAEEILTKSIQKDTRTIDLLVSIGSTQPNLNDSNPEIKSRVDRQKELNDFNKANEQSEKTRLKAINQHKDTVQDNFNSQQNFWKGQKNVLASHAETNNQSKQYFDPKTKEVDPFLVIAESFKDIPLRQDKGSIPVSFNATNPNLQPSEDKYGYHLYGSSSIEQINKKGCHIF